VGKTLNILDMKKIIQNISYLYFCMNGRKPWTWGYDTYKRNHIRKSLNHKLFSTIKLPDGYGFRIDERIIEYPWLISRLPSGSGNLLDAGSVLNHDFILSQETIAEKRVFISTLAPESACFWKLGVSYLYHDLRNTCYRDNIFDWIVSLSTIEHIGMDNSMLYSKEISAKESDHRSYLNAVTEFRRILRPGGKLYLSVPFGVYKNHGWFQVFDGPMVDGLITRFGPAKLSEYYFRYKKEGWKISSRDECKDSTCFDIQSQKIHDEDYAAFSRAVVCLEMVK
jgi:hypothetical protein